MKNIIEEFWFMWGEAPKGTPKYKAGKKAEAFILSALKDQKSEFKMLITKEIVIAQKEGTPTSRLTSLYNHIDKL